MQYSLYATKDNAEGQLSSGISAAALSIPLKAGEGAEFPQPLNGACTSLGSGILLNDTGCGATGIAVGDFIENITDGSHAWVTAVNTNTLSTTQLIGGSDNTWQNSDVWYAKRFIVTVNKRDSNGAITASEKIRISGRSTDTLTVLSGDRGFDTSSAQSFDLNDYVSLFSVSKHIEALQVAVSELAQLVQNLSDTKLSITVDTTQRNADKQKQPCRAATTANVTIATALNNGDTLDGVTLATGDRVLVKNQSSGAENGIYIVGASPARATDFDGNDEVAGSEVWVQEGTVNADTLWICTNDGTPTIGSTSLVFAQRAANTIDDTAYDATTWNGVTTQAPSKNAVRDELEAMKGNQACLQTTRALNTASGSVTLAHGLGRTPKYILVYAVCNPNSGSGGNPYNSTPLFSNGWSNGSSHKCVYAEQTDGGSNPYIGTGQSGTRCLYISNTNDYTNNPTRQEATASFDATNITLDFTGTTTGGVSNTVSITVIVYG